MQLSAEISLYPLAAEYRAIIGEFVERLAQYDELTVNTNTMSTQIFGGVPHLDDNFNRRT